MRNNFLHFFVNIRNNSVIILEIPQKPDALRQGSSSSENTGQLILIYILQQFHMQ